jgi:hypothetical protein
MLEKYIRTVKSQLGYFDGQVRKWSRDTDRPGYDPHKLSKYQRLGNDFQDLLDYLIRQRRLEYTQVDEQPSFLNSQPEIEKEEKTILAATQQVYELPPPTASFADDKDDDLSDLPPELLKELSDSFKGETDPLIRIINDRGGTASLDEILVDLFRKYREVGKRPIISNKLYRFSKRGLCAPMPGKKGFYTTDPTMLQSSGEEEEDPDSEPSGSSSSSAGVAGSQEGPSNPSPVGSSPSTSTFKVRRDLFASTAIPPYRGPR